MKVEPATSTRLTLSGRGMSAKRAGNRRVRLGFIPLTDCAPLVVAKELGLFAQEGLQVELSREPSWANIRDKVMLGALDGAQMLAGMPVASQLGISAIRKPLCTSLSLGLNGNAVTLSRSLFKALSESGCDLSHRPVSARVLRQVVEARQSNGDAPLTFAVVYPTSSHYFELRYWLAEGGIDPDRDVRIVVIPPPQTVAQLRAGKIDGFCVGEPWNSVAVRGGLGHVMITSHQLWGHKPEKVLGVTEDWARRNPEVHRKLLRALMRAGAWLDEPDNRSAAAQWLARPEYVGISAQVIGLPLSGLMAYDPGAELQAHPDFNVFHRHGAMFPWRSHALWFGTQILRWGQLERPENLVEAATRAYRPELYRELSAELGWPCPTIDYKPEGLNAGPWTLAQTSPEPLRMGSDRFFDNSRFDPADPIGYLASFAISNLRVPLAALRASNPVRGPDPAPVAGPNALQEK